ncbi:MAG: exonuclease domain-containing protein, partial [Ornithinibacter sp.]
SFLHYRNFDVSSIKELSRHWYPRAYYNSPAKSGGHRALADIQESIEELRYYRQAVFVPPPGPDTDEVRRIATLHQGALTGSTQESLTELDAAARKDPEPDSEHP